MHVRSIQLSRFMKHVQTELYLPARGVVLITGPNGSGKSTFVEAVSVAQWGKTLRGTPPWVEGFNGMVTVETDQVTAQRVKKGERALIDWARVGQDAGPSIAVDYENNTKSQEALEKVVGEFDVWRRTHVFSSQDAAHFTLSTDADRKRLLESILGLHRFDDALESCRTDRKHSETGYSSANTDMVAAQARLESEQLRVKDALAVLGSLPQPVDLQAAKVEKDRLAKMVASTNGDLSGLQKMARELDGAGSVLLARGKEQERRLAALGAGNCDKCEQPIPQVLRTRLKTAADADREAATKEKEKAAGQLVDLDAQVKELEEEREALWAKQAQLDAKINAETANAQQRARAAQALETAKDGVAKMEANLKRYKAAHTTLGAELKVLEAVEVVLGLKGVRAHVLGKALAGIEQVANNWLQRIAGKDLVLSLRPYSEKKSGGVSDSISLSVDGAGGGFGYKAASGGERRRIDVALLLALAEVASAAHGRTAGTLFFDEVFDALDSQGVEAVSEALSDLSKDRAVVVITHSNELANRLNAVQRVRVDGGKLAA